MLEKVGILQGNTGTIPLMKNTLSLDLTIHGFGSPKRDI